MNWRVIPLHRFCSKKLRVFRKTCYSIPFEFVEAGHELETFDITRRGGIEHADLDVRVRIQRQQFATTYKPLPCRWCHPARYNIEHRGISLHSAPAPALPPGRRFLRFSFDKFFNTAYSRTRNELRLIFIPKRFSKDAFQRFPGFSIGGGKFHYFGLVLKYCTHIIYDEINYISSICQTPAESFENVIIYKYCLPSRRVVTEYSTL
jgi:hypothetical protein